MDLKFQSYLTVKRRPTDGREIELSTSGGYIVWRYAGDIDWINLCLIPADGVPGVDGAPGTNGNDGRDVEFSVVYNHVVWRFVGDETWIDLFELPADGSDGEPGTPGANGNTPYIQGGYWYIDGVSTGVLAAGTPGTNGNTPNIQGGYWYIGGVSTGVLAAGTPGVNGENGREVEFRENAGWVERRYVGDAVWTQLYQIPGGSTDNAIKVAIDFVDAAALTFVYNCPAALVFTSQDSEGDDATISPALNTNMSQYGKVTVTAPAVGLIVLNGNTL